MALAGAAPEKPLPTEAFDLGSTIHAHHQKRSGSHGEMITDHLAGMPLQSTHL
jgi:hypothetical protein